MHGSKTQKNFYIRPTTGVGSKGGFSVERRDQYSKRDSVRNNTNSHNGNGDNLLLQVNSYGFRPPTSSDNNNFLTEQDAMRIASNRLSKLSPLDGKNNINLQRFSSQTQLHGNFYNNSLANQFRNVSISSQQQQRIHAQKTAFSPVIQKNSSSGQQLNQQYRIVKHLSQDQLQENPAGQEANFRKTISSFSGLDALNSRSSLHQQERSPSQQAQQQVLRGKEQGMFEVDISDVNEVQSSGQEEGERNDHRNEENNQQQQEDEEEQEEQLSEIRMKEVQNFEDSLDDIQCKTNVKYNSLAFDFRFLALKKHLCLVVVVFV